MRRIHRQGAGLAVLFGICLAASAGASADGPPNGALPPGLFAAYAKVIGESGAHAFRREGDGFVARSSNLEARAGAGGFEVSGPSGARLAMRLRGIGREDVLAEIKPPETASNGNRVEYRRGAVTEWYVNGGRAFEQGFTVSKRPSGSGKLTLALSIDAPPQAEGKISEDERGLTFVLGDGRRFHYEELHAFDAAGRELPARLTYAKGELRILVEDAGATYPVQIDPVLYLEAIKLTASDGAAFDLFGSSVAISGDTALVGAELGDVGANVEQGSAYVFVRSGGVWTPQQKLTASDGAAFDFFGISVALSGDTALVGAWADDVGANVDQGSAYVFVRAGGVWTEQQKLTASDGVMFDNFGFPVALSGDTALVGRALSDFAVFNFDPGSAYVFVRAGGVWTEQQKLTASDGAEVDHFGCSVAILRDTALVGAQRDDVGPNVDQGSAYVFVRSNGVWAEQQKLTVSDGTAFDRFGSSVALSGDTALVGAETADVGANILRGSAYVFVRSAGGWTEQQKLSASDGAGLDFFGSSVALSGDTALVGAVSDDVVANNEQGSAYVFVRSEGVWSEQQKLTASDGAAQDQFGISVALSGDTALVGASRDSVGANVDQGSAYAYSLFRTDSDLGVDASASAVELEPGAPVFLTFGLANNGPATAPVVTATCVLPPGLRLVTQGASQGTFDPTTGSWNLGTLTVGSRQTLTIQATADPARAGAQLSFTPRVLGGDPNPANNAAAVSLQIRPLELLSNGGLDADANRDKVPDGWTKSKWTRLDGRVSKPRHAGAASVRLTGNGKLKGLQQQMARAGGAGETVVLTAFAKAVRVPARATFKAALSFFNGTALVARKSVSFAKGTRGFRKKQITHATTAPYTRVVAKLLYKGAGGTVFFDTASLAWSAAP